MPLNTARQLAFLCRAHCLGRNARLNPASTGLPLLHWHAVSTLGALRITNRNQLRCPSRSGTNSSPRPLALCVRAAKRLNHASGDENDSFVRDRRLEQLEDRSLLAAVNLIISGSQTLTYNGDVEIASIVGNGLPGADNVTIQATGTVRFSGNAGGAGLHNITVVAHRVDVDSGVVLSTRSIAAGGNQAGSASTGDSGDLSVTGEQIKIGQNAALFAQATGSCRRQHHAYRDEHRRFELVHGRRSDGLSIDTGRRGDRPRTGRNDQSRERDAHRPGSALRSASLSNDLDPASNSGLARQISLAGPVPISGKAAGVASEATATVVIHTGVTVLADQNIAIDFGCLERCTDHDIGQISRHDVWSRGPYVHDYCRNRRFADRRARPVSQATTETNLVVNTIVPAHGDTGNASLSLGNMASTSLVEIQSGVVAQGVSASFKAINSNSISNEASISGLRTGDRVGGAPAVGRLCLARDGAGGGQSNHNRRFDGASRIEQRQNHASAAGNLQSSLAANSTLALNSYLHTAQFVLPATLDPTHATALAATQSVNEAQALILPTAIIQVGQNARVLADTSDTISTRTNRPPRALAWP